VELAVVEMAEADQVVMVALGLQTLVVVEVVVAKQELQVEQVDQELSS
jgi:hypothetical protein